MKYNITLTGEEVKGAIIDLMHSKGLNIYAEGPVRVELGLDQSIKTATLEVAVKLKG